MRSIRALSVSLSLMLAAQLLAQATTLPTNLLKDEKLQAVGGSGSWQASSLEGGSVSVEKDASDQGHATLKLTIDKVDGTDWHAQIYQSGLTVEKGAKYTVSFNAKASAPRKIAVFIQELGSPYKMLSDGHAFDLTSESTPQKVELLSKDGSSDAKLTIVVGQSAGTVSLSDVTLTKSE